MMARARPRRKGSYGIDAPYLLPIPRASDRSPTSSTAWSPGQFGRSRSRLVAACAGCGLYASRRGKFAVWAELLDRLALRGDERVLDLGCGRGAVLLMAAQHLTTGRAVGVDLWRRQDQSGNSAQGDQDNAVAEGVSDRVELHGRHDRAPFRGRLLRCGRLQPGNSQHQGQGCPGPCDRRGRARASPGRPFADRRHLGHEPILHAPL